VQVSTQQPGAAAAVVPYCAATVQLLYLSKLCAGQHPAARCCCSCCSLLRCHCAAALLKPTMCRSAPSSPQELLQLVQLARILYTQFIPRSALLVKISHLKFKKLARDRTCGLKKQIYTGSFDNINFLGIFCGNLLHIYMPFTRFILPFCLLSLKGFKTVFTFEKHSLYSLKPFSNELHIVELAMFIV
jgi:hypothetical protein